MLSFCLPCRFLHFSCMFCHFCAKHCLFIIFQAAYLPASFAIPCNSTTLWLQLYFHSFFLLGFCHCVGQFFHSHNCWFVAMSWVKKSYHDLSSKKQHLSDRSKLAHHKKHCTSEHDELLTMDDSTKHPHSLDASHQSYHSPAVDLPSPEDAPLVDSVACKPDPQPNNTNDNLDALADFNHKLAAVTHQASTNLGNLISPGSQKQKPATTSTGTYPIDQTSSSSWGTPFNPNPLPKDPSSSCGYWSHHSGFYPQSPLPTTSWQTVQVHLSWHVNSGTHQWMLGKRETWSLALWKIHVHSLSEGCFVHTQLVH